MKDNKIIKDLKERNDKLKMQYDFSNIHLISLENKYANLQIENTKLKQDKQEIAKEIKLLLECGMYENYEYTVSERNLEIILEKLGE